MGGVCGGGDDLVAADGLAVGVGGRSRQEGWGGRLRRVDCSYCRFVRSGLQLTFGSRQERRRRAHVGERVSSRGTGWHGEPHRIRPSWPGLSAFTWPRPIVCGRS